jgi:putative hydrolase of the HAD superfamily
VRASEPPRGVLLDLDDTLFDTRGAFRTAIVRLLPRWLPGLDEAARVAAVVRWSTDPGGHFSAYTRNELTMTEQRRLRVLDLHEAFGGARLTDEEVRDWVTDYEAEFRSGWSLLPGAVELLDALDAAGVPLGAVTNASREYQTDKLRAVGLTGRIPLLSCVDDTGVGKPDPQMWLRACDQLGLPARRVAHVGDELDIDARGARNAGLIGVWFDRHGTGSTPDDVPFVRHLADVPGVLGLAAR